MGVMRKAESRVGRTFSGIFGRSFKAHVQPAELAAKMVKEMEDRKTVSLSRTYVPNRLTIYLCPEDRAQFSGYEHGLAEELEGHALQFVLTKSYQLAAPPEVSFETDRDLRLGQFGVRAEMGEAQARGGLRPAVPALELREAASGGRHSARWAARRRTSRRPWPPTWGSPGRP
jgi:hypothetical protein